MTRWKDPWDYLMVTAANDEQAAAYEDQLRLRRRLGLLAGVGEAIVLADPKGKRIGSGGSTLFCLMEVIRRERARTEGIVEGPEAWRRMLEGLRILIIHGGGDSKRLPAYGPCGKIFVPVPGESDTALGVTLFDRQIPTYLALPPGRAGAGQTVIASGDVLLTFDPDDVDFSFEGVTGLGCLASPDEASKHGVYAVSEGSRVRLFLQKPSPEEQDALGAVDRYGQAVLDIGVMSFDARTAAALLDTFEVRHSVDDGPAWNGEMGRAIEEAGLDFYREICCALGKDATSQHHRAKARMSGSRWDDDLLERIHSALRDIPFSARVLPHCGFHHFGTTHQIIHSGLEVLRMDRGTSKLRTCLQIGNQIGERGGIIGTNAWVEGCRIDDELRLGGHNIVVGVDVKRPLELPGRACLGVTRGLDRNGEDAWFVLCYGVEDLFKDTPDEGALFCNRPVLSWLDAADLEPGDVWDDRTSPGKRTVWDARLFPAVRDPEEYRSYLWMFEPMGAFPEQKVELKLRDRYSLAEISLLADRKAFYDRRTRIRAEEIRPSLGRLFRIESDFSASDLACFLAGLKPRDGVRWIGDLLAEAHAHHRDASSPGRRAAFTFSRIIHTLGSALVDLSNTLKAGSKEILPGLRKSLESSRIAWLDEMGLAPSEDDRLEDWADRLRNSAFSQMGRSILTSGTRLREPPSSALRSDEIVWGRAPARLDLGGGWTDTPPYSLEYGGCVINAAVMLNGQSPIQAYARVIPEPLIRIGSIDLGTRVDIETLEDLLDYKSATSEYALAKAALALSGFSPEAADWPEGLTLQEMLQSFGGGIELTTLAAIPKGSGLGTSSIVGVVILAVLHRVLGLGTSRRNLFHEVLRIEQALTTGGGWQDQIGGAVDGVKVAATEPGLVPDARIHYVPADVLDPATNGRLTLLYYTGITRLAKNILRQVVGRYLDRDRRAMATLRRIHALPPLVADAMARKDLKDFGNLIDTAWRLNKELDPDSSNEAVEALLHRVRPHIFGAKLLGAGGGGFLLMVCRDRGHAERVKEMLEGDPPNPRARFFDFNVSREGLAVTVS